MEHEALIVRGEAALLAAARIAPNRQRIDVINGTARLVPILIGGAAGSRREELLASAVRHGEQLIDLAERTEKGWSWDTLGIPNERHLLGFAHGASGVAVALTKLAKAAGRTDFLAGRPGSIAL